MMLRTKPPPAIGNQLHRNERKSASVLLKFFNLKHQNTEAGRGTNISVRAVLVMDKQPQLFDFARRVWLGITANLLLCRAAQRTSAQKWQHQY